MRNIIKKYNNFSEPLKATIWFTGTSFFQKGIVLLTIPLFTRLLSAEEYGIVSVYYTWFDIFLVISTLKLSNGAFSSGYIKFKEDEEKFTSSLLGLSSIITILIFTIYLIFENYLGGVLGISKLYIYIIFLQCFFTSAFELFSLGERFEYRYKKLVLITLSMSMIAPVATIIFMNLTSQTAFIRIGVFVFVQMTVYAFIYLRIMMKGKKFFSWKYWKYGLLINVPLVPHFLAQIILGSSDKLLINYFIGPREAGIYSVAYSAAMILGLLSTSINSSLTPWIYKNLSKGNFVKIPSTINKILLVLILFNILLIGMAPEILRFFAPPEYFEAVSIIALVSASTFFIFLSTLFVSIQIYFEKTGYTSAVSIMIALLNISFNIIFIPIFGYKFAGIMTLISYVFLALINFWISQKITSNRKILIYNSFFILICSIYVILVGLIMFFVYEFPTIYRYIFLLVLMFLPALVLKKIK